MSEDRILESARDLEGYFLQGGKDPGEWGAGIEYERIGILSATGQAVPYHGPRSLSTVLARLVASDGWRPLYAGESIISLEKGRTRITLEPGGQMELSGAVHRRLEGMEEELARWSRITRLYSDALGVTWLGLGLQPFAPLNAIPWVPKPRYIPMSAYLARTGSLAHVMMKQTACVQANLDYSGEADAMEKLRVAMGLTSVVTALFANSPLLEGKPNGYLSYRSWVWQNTDPARCGLLPFVFEPGAGLDRYLDYALDVPMMFIQRGGRFVEMHGVSFRRFLLEGFQDHRPTLEDFELHLTTLFPEIRLKRYVEIRGGDSGDPATALAQVALWKGILYDAAARREAWSLVAEIPREDLILFHREACKAGPPARLAGRTALEIGRDLHRIASSGLERLGESSAYLDPLVRILYEWKACPGQVLLDRWQGDWKREPRRLIEHCSRNTLRSEEPAGGDGGEAEDY